MEFYVDNDETQKLGPTQEEQARDWIVCEFTKKPEKIIASIREIAVKDTVMFLSKIGAIDPVLHSFIPACDYTKKLQKNISLLEDAL